MSKSEDLECCPFCGNTELKLDFSFSVSLVFCKECGAVVSFKGKESQRKTVEAYNRRVDCGCKKS